MNSDFDPGLADPGVAATGRRRANASVAAQGDALGRSDRLIASSAVMIATAMQAADQLIANVALPQLERDLGGGIELGAWVMTSYLCATAVMAPLTGWLRRRYGAGRLFPVAVGAFIAASLLCAVAPNAATLIVFRIFQGAGAGVILPLGQAILLDLYPQERHGRILAIWGAVLMTGPIVGPLLGGIITDLVSWRGVFAINLPLGLLVVAMLRRLPSSDDRQERIPVDAISVALLMIAVGALQLSLERGVGQSFLTSPELLGEAGLSILALAGLLLRARKAGFTIIRPQIFKDVNFSMAAFYNFMTSGMLFVAVVFLPTLAQSPLGFSATLAGFSIVPRAALMTLMMLVVGRLIGKINYRILLGGGWLLMAAGLLLLSRITPLNNPFAWMLIGSTVQGAGAGLLFTPHSTLAFSTLPPELRTEASGVYSLLRQLGLASGVALMTAVLRLKIAENVTVLTAANGRSSASTVAALLDLATLQGYKDCFYSMAIVSLIVIPGVFLFRPPAAGSAQ